jgi:hypothetical protein
LRGRDAEGAEMSGIDWGDLAGRYAEMSDEKIAEMLAEGRESFEALAWDILTAEARRRGLDELPGDSPDLPPPQAEPASWGLILATDDPMEAEIVQGSLQAAGIEVLASGGSSSVLGPFLRVKSGGIKLFVKASELKRAILIIEKAVPSPEESSDKPAES